MCKKLKIVDATVSKEIENHLQTFGDRKNYSEIMTYDEFVEELRSEHGISLEVAYGDKLITLEGFEGHKCYMSIEYASSENFESRCFPDPDELLRQFTIDGKTLREIWDLLR